ncbi:MAG: Rossmann-like and DUF2520 domain-containing protein [Persicimonas sp.]
MSSNEPDFAKMRWAIVGAGRVGRTLGLLADRLGVSSVTTWNRSSFGEKKTRELVAVDASFASPLEDCAPALVADADVVWITAVDEAIEDVARTLAEHVRDDQIALHTSGSLASTVLAEAGIEAAVGSLHPLQAITAPERAVERLGEVAWTLEGDPRALDFGRALLAEIGVEPVVIDPENKALYHASAVTAANLLVALMDAAFAIAEAAGIPRDEARAMLLPLAESCLENLEADSTADALSGPAARGDRATIERHLEALAELEDEQLVQIYQALTRRAEELGK